MRYYVRAVGNPVVLTGNVRQAVRQMDSKVPLNEVETVKSAIQQSIYGDRMVAWLGLAFGALAAGLAALGLYGLVSFMVARRTNEIGLRMALGASRSAVLWLVFRRTLTLIAAGVVLGLALALAATRFVSSMLYGLEATNPLILAGGTLLLGTVAVLATYLPARRATKVEPIVALRYE
jgi:ABC-type antimicrobial peptide transport system permease subunit